MEGADFLPDDFIDELAMDVGVNGSSDGLMDSAPSGYAQVFQTDPSVTNQYYIQMSDVGSILQDGLNSQQVLNLIDELPTNGISNVVTMDQVRPAYSTMEQIQQPQLIQQQHYHQPQLIQQQQQEPQQLQQHQMDFTTTATTTTEHETIPHLEELNHDEFLDADEVDGGDAIAHDEAPAIVTGASPTSKVPRKPRATKKKKDPNAPSPVMSAYSIFFRETQAKVKAANPEAKFGDVSRSVAAMWEALDEQEKLVYRNKSAEDRVRHTREMETYKASMPPPSPSSGSEPSTPTKQPPKSVKVVYLGGKITTTTTTTAATPMATPAMTAAAAALAAAKEETSWVFQGSTLPTASLTSNGVEVKPEDITENECIRDGCNKFAVRSPEWEDEYCSNFCAIRHCKDVFAAFVAGRT